LGRILITGASGDLGRPLSALAASRYEAAATYLSRPERVGGGRRVRLDMRDKDAVMRLVADLRPGVIIHAATSDRSADMYTAIVLSARHIAEAAHRVNARLIALSTDMVFDGRSPPYAEDSEPAPLSDYGRAKRQAEIEILKADYNVLVVRTSLIYDLTPENRQVRWMLDAIRVGKPVMLFTDEIRNPIWACNLAEVLLELAALSVTGVLHVAGGQATSRWDYGCALLAALGYDPTTVGVPVRAAEVAPGRPTDLTMQLDKARRLLRTPLLPLDQALCRAQRGDGYGQATSTTTSL
jgi:dTDP-4-dehydrorhamnose reductase